MIIKLRSAIYLVLAFILAIICCTASIAVDGSAGISAECTAVDVQVRADMYCADRRFERRTA